MTTPDIFNKYDEMSKRTLEYERVIASWNMKRSDILHQRNLELIREIKNLNAPGIKGVSIKLVSQRGAGGLRLVLGYKDLNRGNPIRKINQQISGINTMERPKTPTSRMKDE